MCMSHVTLTVLFAGKTDYEYMDPLDRPITAIAHSTAAREYHLLTLHDNSPPLRHFTRHEERGSLRFETRNRRNYRDCCFHAGSSSIAP